MTGALRKLLLGRYARRAAAPRIVPYPGWTTGSETEADSPEMERRRALWEKLGKSVTVSWLEGLRIRLFPGNETSHVLFLTGLYEPNEFLWLDRFLAPGMTVIDGGANMGLYALYCARRIAPGGLVLAVEPSARELARLEGHVALNRLDNVRVIRQGLAATPGEGRLRIAAEWNAGHNTLGNFGYAETEQIGVEAVPLTTIDKLADKEGLTRVDVVKLDLEGSELAALKGARQTLRRFRPAVLVEATDRTLRHQGASRAALLRQLEDFGYDVCVCDGAGGLVAETEAGPEAPENVIALPSR